MAVLFSRKGFSLHCLAAVPGFLTVVWSPRHYSGLYSVNKQHKAHYGRSQFVAKFVNPVFYTVSYCFFLRGIL